MQNDDTEHAYGVRLRDERNGEIRIDIRPSLVMAQDYRDRFREAYADGGTYYADAEVVERAEGTSDWKVLTDADIARILDESWAALDQAFLPVIAAGLEQLASAKKKG